MGRAPLIGGMRKLRRATANPEAPRVGTVSTAAYSVCSSSARGLRGGHAI